MSASPVIQAFDWDGFERSRTTLAECLRGESIDLIVGLARGGLPLAVCLSHDLDCRAMGVVFVTKTQSEAAFAVLEQGRMEVSALLLPDCEPRTILVVDDIVAVGDAFTAVSDRLRERFGNARQLFATIYADVANIRRGPYASVLERLTFVHEIDNSSVWIAFPWEGA